MVHFIYGKPSSGKSYTVMQTIKELCDNGESSLLIVPEQFTFETERALLSTVGDKAALYSKVLSFSRLYDEIGRTSGGISASVLSSADKIIFMSRALKKAADELQIWKKFVNSVDFAKTVLDTIDELKQNYVTAAMLRSASHECDNNSLKLKLNDLAVLYEVYDTILGETYIDPSDKLNRLYEKLENNGYFKGKKVFFDSFKGFTGQQFKIIERIIATSADTYFTFAINTDTARELDLFTNIRKTCNSIKNIAKKYHKPIADDIYFDKMFCANYSMEAVEQLLSGNKVTAQTGENISVCRAENIFFEAEYAARTIKKLVRKEGYRYRDFVIICRNPDTYSEAVLTACRKNDIPCYFDMKYPLSAFPAAIAVGMAIKACNLSTEGILRFHKTGLGTLDFEETALLENYCYVWNIDGELWLNEWTMDSRGLTTDDDKPEVTAEKIKRINELRVKALKPLLHFKENFCDNAPKMATAVFSLFEDCNMGEKLSEIYEKSGEIDKTFSPDVLRQSYDEYMRILDSIVRCYGDASISKTEFSDALSLAVNLSKVGIIPQTLDEVSFGAADRIRPKNPKIAFILGANQGEFPKAVKNSGILNLSDRKKLIDLGYEISDNSIYTALEEEYLVYSNLCCPSEKLYISYSAVSPSSTALEPSHFVGKIIKTFSLNLKNEPEGSITAENHPETLDMLYSEICRRNNNPSDFSNLAAALDGESLKVLENVSHNYGTASRNISPETAEKLFGKDIYMSPSKLDTFSRCSFSFLCRYGFSAKPLQPAEFNALQKGNLVHFVLEKLLTKTENLFSLSNIRLEKLTEDMVEEYLNLVRGYRQVENLHYQFLVSRLVRSLKEVVCHIVEELKQSDFENVACEMKIGENGSVSFPLEKGKVHLIGTIDRVDVYKDYIRVVDYKTGNRKFRLPDILYGLNLQMLCYLYAVTRADETRDLKPAGILYQPSKRDLDSSGLAMNGLLESNTEIALAMDKSGEGRFAPKITYTKAGTISKRLTSFIFAEDFDTIFDYIETVFKRIGDTLHKGAFSVNPVDGGDSKACKYCEFSSICSYKLFEAVKVPSLKNEEVINQLKGGES